MNSLRKVSERLAFAAFLLCNGSNGLKSAEIPRDASWAVGIEQLEKDSTDETGGIHVCSDTIDGAEHDRWVISVPGTPMDDYRPEDVKEWIGKSREKGETVTCYIDAHNHPPALQKKIFGSLLPNPQSMPPGTGDLWSIYKKSVDAKELGVDNTYAIVVDGLGVWSYKPDASMGEFQIQMLEHLHNVERDQWDPQVGMAVTGWLAEVRDKTPHDVPALTESRAFKDLQAAYRKSGFAITYQSFDAAKKISPRTYMSNEK